MSSLENLAPQAHDAGNVDPQALAGNIHDNVISIVATGVDSTAGFNALAELQKDAQKLAMDPDWPSVQKELNRLKEEDVNARGLVPDISISPDSHGNAAGDIKATVPTVTGNIKIDAYPDAQTRVSTPIDQYAHLRHR